MSKLSSSINNKLFSLQLLLYFFQLLLYYITFSYIIQARKKLRFILLSTIFYQKKKRFNLRKKISDNLVWLYVFNKVIFH